MQEAQSHAFPPDVYGLFTELSVQSSMTFPIDNTAWLHNWPSNIIKFIGEKARKLTQGHIYA